ncbi:hypothetical protein CL673_02705 [Candidatus Bathyarchaeota archaeon]|nr:hypothetical protein [Candidatus Bathyarchaeota archaeon]
MYVVVSCKRCNNLLLGDTRHRTRACPHCGLRMVLRGQKVLARTEFSQDAVAMIQELKKRDVK